MAPFCKRVLVPLIFILCFLYACTNRTTEKKLFRLVSADQSGITFENTITETDSFNVLNFEYIYNGAGVGVADVNNDSLLDIYFGGNMVSSRLYLNRGNFLFEEVTDEAKVATYDWCTGIAMVDINQDGKMDIHVSTITPALNKNVKNLFFINQGNNENGIPVFAEMANQLGVADTSYSTQSTFFDYDLDGDLDMYLLTNANELFVRSNPIGQRHDGKGKSIDKLYQNTGNDSLGYPIFKDVSVQAGILSEGWGLGIVVSDFNKDGYPDIYAANDFMSNDHLYINNQDGTFSEQSRKWLKHQEMNGMGVDIADLNNDGLQDIVAVDMLPEDNKRQKTMFSEIGYDRFQLALEKKYQPQYVRNVLQLNNGNGTFSDVGYFSGIYATDWSWSPLIADFDNDGWRDIFITNGYVRDITDLDFGVYASNTDMFGTKEARRKKLVEQANKLVGINKPNLLYHNNKDLTFTNTAEEWGLADPSYSNGAAYADFDNDGDLDIVTNNLNSQAFLYENTTIASPGTQSTTNGFLRIKLEGPLGNRDGIGASVSIYYADGGYQFIEKAPQRGYKSTVEPYLHFGLASVQVVDSVIVTWPGFKAQRLTQVKSNQLITVREADASPFTINVEKLPTLFTTVDHQQLGLSFVHRENDFADYKVTPLLPRKHSQQGPSVCAGDVNGDGMEDFIVGGVAHQPAILFTQLRDGRFKQQPLLVKDEEDAGMLLFDADGDGDLDWYCVSGGTELGKGEENYNDRLYFNDGKGNFTLNTQSLPVIRASGSCVIGHDFDRDGDVDLFIGGRIKPGSYPLPPNSYVLQNNGNGVFADITDTVAPGLRTIGMVTSAIWTDFNNDTWPDLMVVGEFMPITFFKNEGGKKLINDVALTLDNSTGWWNSVTGGDFDNDGDIDYVAGNLGLNSAFKSSPAEPVSVYAKDYDQNGSVDPILTRFISGVEYPVHPRETFTAQIVGLKRILRTYETYGKMPFHELFSAEMLENAHVLSATEFRSCFIENLGNGKFALKPLPARAQFAPVCGMLTRDINDDGHLDLITIGNDYSAEPLTGYYDAGIGTCLIGDGKGNFSELSVLKSGFVVDGDAKALIALSVQGRELVLATQNGGSLAVFSYGSEKGNASVSVNQDDYYAAIYQNGRVRKQEFYLGDSYLAQSSHHIHVPANADSVVVVNHKGAKRVLRRALQKK